MPLSSISPIDGRYRKSAEPLAQYFSEQSLMKYRLIVEGEYLIALSELKLKLRKLSDKEKKLVRSLYDLNETDAQIISDIEFKGYKNIPSTNHDVKAVEYYMKLKLSGSSLKDVLEWIHFALTSEDTNNLAYALMLKNGITDVLLPLLNEIIFSLTSQAQKYKDFPMLARTHGQPASPTTFGKELRVFKERLLRQVENLKSQNILCKINGATGNYNAHMAAYPKVDWPKFSQKFIESLSSNLKSSILNLKSNIATTQIEPHDSCIEIFDCLRRINNILIDFNQDTWRYISDGWIKQRAVKGEIGSSTMPHKINPINFENSEGNLGLANALFNHFAMKLPISRLQRDLSDSTVQRNFGTALGHCVVGYKYLIKGLAKIEPDPDKMLADLESHPEVVAEAIQTVLRREGAEMPYEKLKELTRGKKVEMADIEKFIDSLNVDAKIKKELKAFSPKTYTGLASKLAQK